MKQTEKGCLWFFCLFYLSEEYPHFCLGILDIPTFLASFPCDIFLFFILIHRQIDDTPKYRDSRSGGIYSIIALWNRRFEMMKSKKDEIVLLHKSIACLEEEVQAKNEIIRQQERIIRTLQDHNDELTALMNRIFDSLKKG